MTEPPDRRRLIREVAMLYGITLVVTVGLTLLQGTVGWLRGYLLVLVAGTFLYLPIEYLHRTGRDPADFGIHRRNLGRALRLALIVMAVTFPPYLIGFHVWQGEVLGQHFTPEDARYDQWPIELEDEPKVQALDEGEVRLFEVNNALWLQWHLPAGQRFEAVIKSDDRVEVRAGVQLIHPEQSGLKVRGRSDGRVAFEPHGEAFSIDIEAGGDRLPDGRLRLGTALVRAEVPYQADRSYLWLLNLILVQILLVALPEEVFYRGYLQTRLDQIVGRDRKILGVEVNVTSLVLTSALFAVGHIATIPVAGRLAVFFPSLLFGWMRRATGGVAAGVLYHAACNILVNIAAHLYA